LRPPWDVANNNQLRIPNLCICRFQLLAKLQVPEFGPMQSENEQILFFDSHPENMEEAVRPGSWYPYVFDASVAIDSEQGK